MTANDCLGQLIASSLDAKGHVLVHCASRPGLCVVLSTSALSFLLSLFLCRSLFLPSRSVIALLLSVINSLWWFKA